MTTTNHDNIFEAIKKKDSNEFNELISKLPKGANLNNIHDDKGQSIATALSKGGMFKQINELAQNKAIDIAAADKNGALPIISNSSRIKIDTIELAIKNGLDINKADENNRTILSSSSAKDFKRIKALVEMGADIKNAPKATLSNLMMEDKVIKSNKSLIIDLIEAEVGTGHTVEKGITTFYLAARATDDREILMPLIKSKKAAIQDLHGYKPIFECIKRGYTDLVEAIIDEIDINEVSKKGESMLHSAIRTDNFEVGEMLINKGISLEIKNNFNMKAIELADCLTKDKWQGIINSRKTITPTDIFSAISSNNPAAVSKLAKGSSNIQNSDGISPTQFALNQEANDCLIELIKSGETPTAAEITKLPGGMKVIIEDMRRISQAFQELEKTKTKQLNSIEK